MDLSNRKSKQGIHVVTPDWITECVKAGKKISEARFSLTKVKSGIQGLSIQTQLALESFMSKRPSLNSASKCVSSSLLPPPPPQLSETSPPHSRVVNGDESYPQDDNDNNNNNNNDNKEGDDHDNQLNEQVEEIEPSAINKEYLPEKVFAKSRFHVMGEIKRSLQELVTKEYAKQHSLPPSRL